MLLTSKIKEVRVSSVLNDDRKVYGKKFLFDGRDETCWNSDQGLPQWIQVTFLNPVQITQINLQFQGGFAGKDCILIEDENSLDSKKTENGFKFCPEDTNSLQKFIIPNQEENLLVGRVFKLVFKNSTDFYGRIILYNYEIYGTTEM